MQSRLSHEMTPMPWIRVALFFYYRIPFVSQMFQRFREFFIVSEARSLLSYFWSATYIQSQGPVNCHHLLCSVRVNIRIIVNGGKSFNSVISFE